MLQHFSIWLNIQIVLRKCVQMGTNEKDSGIAGTKVEGRTFSSFFHFIPSTISRSNIFSIFFAFLLFSCMETKVDVRSDIYIRRFVEFY